MFKTNIIDNKCLWLKTCPHFTPPFTEKRVVFCISTILVSIPISLNRRCFNFFGVTPNSPTTAGITFTGISHILFNSLFRLLKPLTLSFSLSSILLSYCLNEMTWSVSIVKSHIFRESFSTTFSGSCLYCFQFTANQFFCIFPMYLSAHPVMSPFILPLCHHRAF